MFSFVNAQADNSLDKWRNEIAAVRQLAENDIPRAYKEAQQLQAELPATATPADQVALLNLLSRVDVYGAQTGLAAQHIRQAREIASRNNNRIGRIEADLNLALNAINQGRIDDMVESVNHAMSLLEGVDRPDLRIEAMLRTAMMYLRLGQVNDALKLALQTMEVAKNSEIPQAMMYAHHGMAVIFDQQGSKDKALHHYEQMVEQARIAGSKFWQAFGLFGLGGVLVASGDVAGGDKLKQEGIELCRSVGAPFCLSQGLFHLASSFQLQNRHGQALPIYDEIVSIYESRDNKIALWWAINARSSSYQEIGQLDAAWQDAQQSQRLAKEIGVTRYLSMAARRMAAVAAARGEYHRAYQLSVEAANLKGQMEREQSSERITKLAEQYQEESKQRRIDELTRNNERHELQQRWLWTVMGAIFVILVGTVYFVFHMRRANCMLATANTSLERWHDMFEHADWGVVIGGLDATLELINPAFAHMHGYTVEELTGRPIIDVYVPEKRESLLHEIELIHEKGHHSFESVHLRKDGTTFPVFVDATAVYDSSGSILHRVVNIQDITDRKRLEDHLRQSEQQFRSLAESSPDSIIRYDLDHRILYLNGNLVQVLGLGSQDEVVGKRPIEVWPDGRYAKIDEATVKAIKTGNEFSVDLRELDEDGKLHYFYVTVVPERDATGEIIGTIAFGREVTTIREIERNLRTLMENIPDLIARYDEKGHYLYVNPAIERAFGMPVECFIGKKEGELDLQRPTEQFSELADGVRRAFAEGVINRAEAKWDLPEGERYFDILHVPEKDETSTVISVLGIAHDITERKQHQVQEEIRLSIFEQLAEGGELPEILDLIAQYVEQERPDFFINIMLVAEDAKHLVMVSAPRLPVNYSAAVDGIAIAEGNGSCGTAAWRGKTVIATDIRTHPYWEAYKQLAVQAGLLACWSEPIHGSSGRVLGTFGVYLKQPGEPSDSDLETIRHASHLAAIAIERRQMEASLRKSEQDFRALAEHSPDYVSRYDSQCRRVYVNPTMQEIFGLPEGQILGKTPVELSPIPASQEFMDRLQEVLSTHSEREWEFEFSVNESDMRWGHMRIVPEFDMDGNVTNVLAIGRDFTELKKAEMKLEETQAELRELAAYREKDREDERKGIARELHDELGQMLTAIRMEVSLLKMQFGLDSAEFQDKMQDVVELVDKTIRSVRNVVVMLRPAALERGVVPALRWLVGEFTNQGRIICNLNISDENIDIDEEHAIAIFRIVQESLTNVAKHSGARNVGVVLETKGDSYHLTIYDNGKGFDPSIQKEKSMGLIGIRERVLRLGGELKIDSVINKGTTIQVRIPLRLTL